MQTLNAHNIAPQPGYAIATRPVPLSNKPRPSDHVYRLETDLRPGPDVKSGARLTAGSCVLVSAIEGAVKGPNETVLFIIGYDHVLASCSFPVAEGLMLPTRGEVFGEGPSVDEEALERMIASIQGAQAPPAGPTDEPEGIAEPPPAPAPPPAQPKPKQPSPTAPQEPKRTPGTTRRDDPRNVEPT